MQTRIKKKKMLSKLANSFAPRPIFLADERRQNRLSSSEVVIIVVVISLFLRKIKISFTTAIPAGVELSQGYIDKCVFMIF